MEMRAETTVGAARTATLVLHGELDIHTASGVVEEIGRLVASGADDVHIDATLVDFVDSTGLGALVGAHKRATTAGVALRLEPSDRMRRLLARTGLLGFFGLTAV